MKVASVHRFQSLLTPTPRSRPGVIGTCGRPSMLAWQLPGQHCGFCSSHRGGIGVPGGKVARMRGSGQSSNCRSSGGRCVLPGSVSTADGGTGVTMIVEGGAGGVTVGGDGEPIGGTVGVIRAGRRGGGPVPTAGATVPGEHGVLTSGGRCGGTVAIGGVAPPGKLGVMPSGGRCGGTVPIGGVTPPGKLGVMPSGGRCGGTVPIGGVT